MAIGQMSKLRYDLSFYLIYTIVVIGSILGTGDYCS